MNSSWIDISTRAGETFAGYLSLPPTGSGPGIVLVQEIWGVNQHIRAVADQYALAVVLYEMLTGRSPWDISSHNVDVLAQMHVKKTPKPLIQVGAGV